MYVVPMFLGQILRGIVVFIHSLLNKGNKNVQYAKKYAIEIQNGGQL